MESINFSPISNSQNSASKKPKFLTHLQKKVHAAAIVVFIFFANCLKAIKKFFVKKSPNILPKNQNKHPHFNVTSKEHYCNSLKPENILNVSNLKQVLNTNNNLDLKFDLGSKSQELNQVNVVDSKGNKKEIPDSEPNPSPNEPIHALEAFLQNYDNIFVEIDQAVVDKDINKLRKLAYKSINLAFYKGLIGTVQFDLYPQFQKKYPDYKKIAKIIKEDLLPKIKYSVEIKIKSLSINVEKIPRPPHWNLKDKPLPFNTKVSFAHGGGIQFITQFLTGKTPGYSLEKKAVAGGGGKEPGLGIQVHPYLGSISENVNERLAYYARTSSAAHMDYPAYLLGEVEIQYLDSANNNYEAGIRAEFLDKIKNLQIYIIPQKASGFTEKLSPEAEKELFQLDNVKVHSFNHLPDFSQL